jgi:histidinol phosphatase-like PHP family hydrolase
VTPPADINSVVAALLHDMAFVQPDQGRALGYKRAAVAVLTLERALTELVDSDGTLPKIAGLGPASSRIALEALTTGGSTVVEKAVQTSPKAADVERRRQLRGGFLSRAAVIEALRPGNDKLIQPSDYKADFQMHSVWSDGRQTVADLAAGCVRRGYTHCAVTDHSAGLKIAGGVTIERFVQQHEEIDAINAECGDRFTVLKGVEANIGVDGSLDVETADLARFDLVLAAPHSKLRIADDQTPRLLAAISIPGVHILAHPRGRMYGSRAGVRANWDRVFAEAARRDVAIEIDGDPHRQDLDFSLAARALDAGCLLALDSDAHHTEEFGYVDIAIAHARLAGASADRVINCWDLKRLQRWAASHRS